MAWILQASQLFLINQNKVVNVAMGLRSIPVHEMGKYKLKKSKDEDQSGFHCTWRNAEAGFVSRAMWGQKNKKV